MSKTTNTVKYGKIEIPIEDGTSAYVPKQSTGFIDHGDMLKTLAIGIRDNLSVLIIGESGTGKTSAIRYLATETQNGLRRVNLNGGTTADELVGRLLINDKGTYWVDGVLTEAMRRGEWIVLDEINAALPEVLFVLQSVMDDDGYLVLNEKDDKEIVQKHPNFRLFATCNPPEYAGTKEMNKALLSRFAICISADFPPEAKELEIIEQHLGNAVASTDLTKKLVGLANDTRKAKEMGNADYAINTRDVLNTLRLAEYTDPLEALMLSFANKLDGVDNKALKAVAKLHLPSSKKKGAAARTQIISTEELEIGKHIALDADAHNAYYGTTDDDGDYLSLKALDLGEILANCSKEEGIKGDEFTIDGTYYEEGSSGASLNPEVGLGSKTASAITFTAGPSKGSHAVLIHHKDLNDSAKIVESLFEIA